jgi:hypothetical protein
VDLIKKLKGVFNKDNIIEINVFDELDETEYLFSTASNRESLYRSLEQFKKGEFVSRDVHELEVWFTSRKRHGNNTCIGKRQIRPHSKKLTFLSKTASETLSGGSANLNLWKRIWRDSGQDESTMWIDLYTSMRVKSCL